MKLETIKKICIDCGSEFLDLADSPKNWQTCMACHKYDVATKHVDKERRERIATAIYANAANIAPEGMPLELTAKLCVEAADILIAELDK